MKKGFTLIELLAVITILGILAAVSFPIIGSVLNGSKEKLYTSQVKTIVDAAKKMAADDSNLLIDSGSSCITLDSIIRSGHLNKSDVRDPRDNSTMNGSVTITFDSEYNLYNYTYQEKNCPYKNIVLNDADPILDDGMIPIVWSNDKWVKANIEEEWYDYTSQEWANMVLVTDSSRNAYKDALVGAPINNDDVLGYFVWIPRYKYQLFNTKNEGKPIQKISIIFESTATNKTTGRNNGEWLTHPAFTFGNKEINGFWMAKFETTGDTTTPTIKPNLQSLTNMNASTMYTTAQKLNNVTNYGLTSKSDAHMLKNMEWGAVAYLSQSSFGKYGNPIYTGATGLEKEIYINNVHTGTSEQLLTAITGCAGDSVSASRVDNRTTCVNEYHTAQGIKASTTGNITGVYDMSGGTWEYVMGVQYNSNANTNLSIESLGFSQETLDGIDSKYIDKYAYGTSDVDHQRGMLGDATKETVTTFGNATGGWNSDYAGFVKASYPLFARGGRFDRSSNAGVFEFYYSYGGGSLHSSFRIALVAE